MRKRGFILGKFLPPHAGHLFVCRTAASMVDDMTVLVCSTDREPIPGRLRHEWMRELLPGQDVLHMHRDIPQEPANHPDFWRIWQAAVREYHPEPIDRVFGSETYVMQLADILGAEPVIIDPDRKICPVSATDIRNDPHGNWDQIPSAVRPYFQTHICLLGPESTGKSTLAAILAKEFSGTCMPEYGRTYDAVYRQGGNWQAADLIALAETHLAMRRTLARHARPLLVEDTDAIQTAVWAEYLLGSVPIPLEEMIAASDVAGLYLVLSPDVTWIDDGTRYSGKDQTRTWFYRRCCARLRERGLNFQEVTGTNWTERADMAAQYVREFIGA